MRTHGQGGPLGRQRGKRALSAARRPLPSLVRSSLTREMQGGPCEQPPASLSPPCVANKQLPSRHGALPASVDRRAFAFFETGDTC